MAKGKKPAIVWPDEFKNYEEFVSWVKSNIGEASEEFLQAVYSEFYID